MWLFFFEPNLQIIPDNILSTWRDDEIARMR